ncbi:MAG: hypothetical protein M3081_12275, partial [Gemmatimonadota bacterium]|nr:hypothetical protein [Gemmatimonadota bacterium]
AAIGASGCASLRAPQPSHQFLERFYVSKAIQDSTLLYEAQAVAHIFLVDQLPDAYDRISSDARISSAGGWRVIATPMFRIRQLTDSSAAVRTPSFMPRVSVEYLWASRLGTVTGDESNPAFGGVWLKGIRVALAHHSNGQAGCFRDGFVPVDRHANSCVPAPGADTNIVKLNRANGDFSTTYLSLLGHSTWMNLGGANKPTHTVGVALGLDWHAPGIFGALSDEQRALYGSWRANVQTEGMQVFGTTCGDPGDRTTVEHIGCALAGRSRITLMGERAPHLTTDLARRIQPAVVPYEWSIELSHAFDALLGAGPFIRWHDGQDYYNIGFVNRRRVTMVGIMLDMSGLDRVGKKIVQ